MSAHERGAHYKWFHDGIRHCYKYLTIQADARSAEYPIYWNAYPHSVDGGCVYDLSESWDVQKYVPLCKMMHIELKRSNPIPIVNPRRRAPIAVDSGSCDDYVSTEDYYRRATTCSSESSDSDELLTHRVASNKRRTTRLMT